jgi:hypothetical protein
LVCGQLRNINDILLVMTKDEIKRMLRARIIRFYYDDAMHSWSRKQLHAEVNPRGHTHEVDEPTVQDALLELENDGLIKLVRTIDVYFKVLPLPPL